MANMINTLSRSLENSEVVQDVLDSPQVGPVKRTIPLTTRDGARQLLSTRRTSHHRERRPGQQRTPKQYRHLPALGFHNIFVVLIIIISSCSSLATASPRPHPAIPEIISAPRAPVSQEKRYPIDRSEPLLVDVRPPPPSSGVAWHYNSYGEVLEGPEDPYLDDYEDSYLQKRQDLFGDTGTSTTKTHSSTTATSTTIRSSTSTSATPSTTSKAAGTSSQSSSTLASTTSSGLLVTSTGDANTPLPSPFDSSLGNNFTTAACPAYIQSFLAETQFKACLPFSLLLKNSNSFFQAEKSIVRITQVLDATCSASSSTCATYLSSLAANLTSPANCQADYQAQNPIVVQAYTGLLAYLPLYSASCLKNTKTQAYCFADAITNASSTTDSYVYFLPLNMTLSSDAKPTCSNCLKQTMEVFNTAAANRSQAIANTYSSAAQQINLKCGSGFVTSTIPAASGGVKFSNGLMHGNVAWVAMMMCVLAWFL